MENLGKKSDPGYVTPKYKVMKIKKASVKIKHPQNASKGSNTIS